MKNIERQKAFEIAGEKYEGELEADLFTFDTRDLDNDEIKSGALDDWMKSNDTAPMLWSHKRDEVIGEWSKFRIVEKTLKATGTLYEGIQRASEAIVLLKNKAVKGVSIGFDSTDYEYRYARVDGKFDFGIDFQKIQLREASLVLNPAYVTAQVTDLKNAPVEAVKAYLDKQGLTEAEILKIVGEEEARKREKSSRITVAGKLAEMLAA